MGRVVVTNNVTLDGVVHAPGNDLVILGSGELVASLMPRDLIDEYALYAGQETNR